MIWKTAIKKTNQIHSSTSDNELTEKRQLNNWQCRSLSPHHCKTNCPRAILETLTNWKDYWKDLRARICGSTPSKSVGCVDVVDITDVGDVALPTACLAPHHCNVNRQVCHCALRSLGGCAGDSAFEGASFENLGIWQMDMNPLMGEFTVSLSVILGK